MYFKYCEIEELYNYRFSGIVRRPVKEYRLPTLEEVDLALSYSTYDRPPYNEIAGDGVFRSCFEGGCPMPGQTYSIHNLVSLPLLFFISMCSCESASY